MPCRPVALPIVLAVFLLPAPGASATTEVTRQEATAYARKGQAVLYRESHWRYRQDGTARRLVLYRCADGQPFARKTVVERPSAQAPDFAFEDARDGYREGVRSTVDRRLVYVQEPAGGRAKERAVTAPAGAVIDAGFDASVRLHWNALNAGRPVTQPFLLPSRFDFVPVRLDPGPVVRWNGVAARRLSMKLDRWYGFVAPTMQLTYAETDQRLLEFAGIATIRDAKGRHQDVRIVFPQPAAPADARGLQQALATPLVRQCQA